MPHSPSQTPDDRTASGAPTASTLTRVAALDVVSVLAFAASGRAQHGTGTWGFLLTAWPFLVGLAAGWLLLRVWRTPERLWPEGVVLVAVTVAIGMALRVATGGGNAPWTFVMVATITLTLLMLGHRLVAGLVHRRRTRGVRA